MVSLKQIFDWFKTGLYPTEGQFKQTWQSFWHKSERIPAENIDGLPELIDKKSVLYSEQNLTNEEQNITQNNIGIDYDGLLPEYYQEKRGTKEIE